MPVFPVSTRTREFLVVRNGGLWESINIPPVGNAVVVYDNGFIDTLPNDVAWDCVQFMQLNGQNVEEVL
jgi:hypothetical protein